ncbi:hypothetical protein TNCV_3011471 [Trichonephila clavipes]|nr:hypothetical protein TNCV_3011471 [Trichonephila clavipes]
MSTIRATVPGGCGSPVAMVSDRGWLVKTLFHVSFNGEQTNDGQRSSTSLSLPPTSQEDLGLDDCVTPCLKDTIHLLTYMPSPGFEPRLYIKAASITNHYTGWVAPTITGPCLKILSLSKGYIVFLNVRKPLESNGKVLIVDVSDGAPYYEVYKRKVMKSEATEKLL